MQSQSTHSHSLLASLAILFAAFAPGQRKPVEPLRGSLVVDGGGPLRDNVAQVFARLAGGGAGHLVLIADRKKTIDEKRWKTLGTASVQVVRLAGKSQVRSEKVLTPLLRATGIWLASDVSAIRGSALFEQLLQAAVARGGVVGGTGSGARMLAKFQAKGDKRPVGFDLLPRAVIHVHYATSPDATSQDARLREDLARNPGCVGWGIPEGSALVVYGGRRVGVVGKDDVTAIVPANGAWRGRVERFDPDLYVERWDELPYCADLLAWTRSAALRQGPLFPPQKAPVPRVDKGTLVLSGGKGVADETFDRFIAAAGGKGAVFVCIPTADDGDEHDRSSYGARALRWRGCKNVHVLHTRIRGKANGDEPTLAPLRKANGVWMDGGRTYRLVDAYQGTTVHELMKNVLERGGVIGGSSAGCQAQGDFLMRGRPISNRPLWWDGYQTGLGFLRGVIIDAHFRQRDRQKSFPDIMRQFPQMLGIGVDEKAALIVRGHVAEVVGDNAVSFFDYTKDREDGYEGVVLRAGRKYDLKARAPLRD